MVEQVGDQQQAVGPPQRPVPGLGHQLEDRVDLDQLDAGGQVQPLPADPADGLLEQAPGARVAVADRVAERPAVAVEQPVVHPPGVDPDGVDPARGRARGGQALLDLRPQAAQVPAETAGVLAGRRREAVDLLEGDPGAVEAPEHDPAALRAEVDGDQVAGGHRSGSTGTRWTGTPAVFQARTSSSGTPSSQIRPVTPAVSTNGCSANRPTLLESNSP